jgi:3',5'-cyclic-nucleotide phosphodiesterase
MFVTAFSLSHSNPNQSTAFLVRHEEAYLLYLGDTGADSVEHSDKMHNLWQQVSPLLTAKKLKALFIEVSFDNEQPDKQLFGHLTPHWLMSALQDLALLSGTEALKDFPVVITHIKPGGNREQMIRSQHRTLRLEKRRESRKVRRQTRTRTGTSRRDAREIRN